MRRYANGQNGVTAVNWIDEMREKALAKLAKHQWRSVGSSRPPLRSTMHPNIRSRPHCARRPFVMKVRRLAGWSVQQ